jgi:hypothetical protein
LLATFGVRKDLLLFLLVINQVVAILSVRSRILIYCLAPFGVVVSVYFLNVWLNQEMVTLVSSPLLIALVFATTVATFLYAVRRKQVDSECIYAALSAYLLAGICMGLTYWFVERLMPGSFLVGGTKGGEFPLNNALYFSFVTITTTGFGDITPISDVARGLTMFEALVGQLYLASMLARLVSVYSKDE